jgi:hypothetical protein
MSGPLSASPQHVRTSLGCRPFTPSESSSYWLRRDGYRRDNLVDQLAVLVSKSGQHVSLNHTTILRHQRTLGLLVYISSGTSGCPIYKQTSDVSVTFRLGGIGIGISEMVLDTTGTLFSQQAFSSSPPLIPTTTRIGGCFRSGGLVE